MLCSVLYNHCITNPFITRTQLIIWTCTLVYVIIMISCIYGQLCKRIFQGNILLTLNLSYCYNTVWYLDNFSSQVNMTNLKNILPLMTTITYLIWLIGHLANNLPLWNWWQHFGKIGEVPNMLSYQSKQITII